MAARKKTTKKEQVLTVVNPDEEVKQEEVAPVPAPEPAPEPVTPEETPATPEPEPEKPKKSVKKQEKKQKFDMGAIVFISKEADTDLNGFKLFPQYKKYTYTVEAYDEISGVYTLRRLNLSLRLPEALILAPNERAHDPLHRLQF